jgi:carboxymethylenebutenolidase
MCDDDIHPGLVHDPRLSRRAFGLAAAALGGVAATAAGAQSPVVEKDVEIKTPTAWPTPPSSTRKARVLAGRAGLARRDEPAAGVPRHGQAPGRRRLRGAGPQPLLPGQEGAGDRGDVQLRQPRRPRQADPAARDGDAGGHDRDAAAYVAFLDAQPQTNKAKKVGVQGYCMGGPLSFRTAAAAPGRIGAVATFHGGGLVTDQPTSPHLLIPKTHADYLIAVADNDDKQDPTVKDKLKAAFAEAKRPAKVEVFEGAAHGWTVKGSQVYNEPAAEKAWAELLALYKKALA